MIMKRKPNKLRQLKEENNQLKSSVSNVRARLVLASYAIRQYRKEAAELVDRLNHTERLIEEASEVLVLSAVAQK